MFTQGPIHISAVFWVPSEASLYATVLKSYQTDRAM